MARILVVDDSSTYRINMREILESVGHTIVGEAVNGVEAVEKYKELNPDITTMDISMPIKRGLDALKEIIEFDPDAKVIMISAAAQQKTISEAFIHGAYDFFPKPLVPKQIIHVLDNINSFSDEMTEKE